MTTTNDNLKPAKRQPVRTTDTDGAAIVRVPLATGETAVVDAADFDRLMQHGITGNWTLNWNWSRHGAYVRCAHRNASGNLFTVVRLIMEAPAGTWVRYHDGNHLNLRRSNLYLETGQQTKGREREAMMRAQAA